jgi:hypothetical protein
LPANGQGRGYFHGFDRNPIGPPLTACYADPKKMPEIISGTF